MLINIICMLNKFYIVLIVILGPVYFFFKVFSLKVECRHVT